jgi:hypothetical protein
MPHISFIIPCYNGAQLLENVLAGIVPTKRWYCRRCTLTCWFLIPRRSRPNHCRARTPDPRIQRSASVAVRAVVPGMTRRADLAQCLMPGHRSAQVLLDHHDDRAPRGLAATPTLIPTAPSPRCGSDQRSRAGRPSGRSRQQPSDGSTRRPGE